MIYPKPLSEQDTNSLFAKLDSPSLTGTPKTPTPTSSSNSKMIANKEYVDVSISNLINAAPSALDTLNELATALGNDPNFATTISNQLGTKLDSNSANYIKSLSISGKTITYTKGNDTTGTLTTQDTVYTHPTNSGNKHIPAGGSSGQFLKWSADGTAVWAADNDTHWTTHLYAGATGTAAHASTSNGSTYLVLSDESGSTKNVRNNIRITGSGATTVSSNGSGVITISSTDNNTTYSNFVKSGSSAAAGLVPKPPTTAGTTKYLREDGTWQVPPDNNTTYSNFVKSGASAAAGLVPKPSTTAGTTRYLREDCTWQVPPDNNTTYSVFVKSGSTAAAGLVPKPSTTAGTAKYLREDCTWSTPPNTTYTAASATPKAPGTAAVGTSAKYAREDHVHPLQTSVSGNAANVTGTVEISHGGTSATTRLAALKNLTNENVGTNAQYFLTITDSWGKGGYTSVANAKSVLGLGSAAYTNSNAYLAASGTASSATKLATARTITVKIKINGMTLSGSASFDGTGNITIDMGSITRAQLLSTTGGGSSCGDCSDWCEAEGGGVD